MKNEKGVSAIVATALILLITVAAVTVVWSVVIPMITTNLESSQACLNAPSALDIKTNTGMTCYKEGNDTTNATLYVQIGRSTANIELSKINLRAIDSNGNSDNIELEITSAELGTDGLQAGDIYRYVHNYANNSANIVSVEITPVVKVGATDYSCSDAVASAEVPICA